MAYSGSIPFSITSSTGYWVTNENYYQEQTVKDNVMYRVFRVVLHENKLNGEIVSREIVATGDQQARDLFLTSEEGVSEKLLATDDDGQPAWVVKVFQIG